MMSSVYFEMKVNNGLQLFPYFAQSGCEGTPTLLQNMWAFHFKPSVLEQSYGYKIHIHVYVGTGLYIDVTGDKNSFQCCYY